MGKNKQRKLPGMTSGAPTVYKKGRTRKQDSIYRDVYGAMEKERGNRPEPTSKAYVPVGAFLAGSLTAGVMFGALPLVYSKASEIADSLNLPFEPKTFMESLHAIAFGGFLSVVPYGIVAGVAAIAHAALKRNWQAQNANNIHTDIDMYESDSYIQQPIQLPYSYDIFPDAGAHSDVSPTAVLAHMMFSKKGVKMVEQFKRRKAAEIVEYEYDDDSTETVTFKKGSIIKNDKDEPIYEKHPLIDEAFGDRLFTASFIPKGKDGAAIRMFYDTTKLLYNPTQNVLGKSNEITVAEHINNHWEFPSYEVQRPAGAYIVDTAPNNTMVLAMTRAGKGQTIIEPTIDMWTREKNVNNMAINDPKGELYVKFYYPASMRGLDVISFNLINPSRTNIYNPLGYAIDAARQGDNQKVEELVSSIGDVFFPTEKADDPMWPNAANAAFKRSALGLIDYFQEEEREHRIKASRLKTNPAVVDQQLDEMWGRVTLYNVYQMMTELASHKSSAIDMIHIKDDDPSEEKDYLTLFFDATNELPKNALRTSTANQDNSLRAMAGSDKTIASVYGISLTAMLFFADEKISRLTSGRPSQNFDMVGLGFPRRLGVRFEPAYLKKYNLSSQRTRWTAYRNKDFTDPYLDKKGNQDKDFMHESRVDSNGWTFFFFKGIFENQKTYVKLEIFADVSGLLAHTYYFEFTKDFQKSLNGRTYVQHPVHKERIIHNGTLREMQRTETNNTHHNDGKSGKTVRYSYGSKTIRRKRLLLTAKHKGEEVYEAIPVFSQSEVHYTEKPKAIFFITPPHLMTYAKIILILINQMFNMQVDKAYLTKANQKPLYKTRYMLDEVGNLQSEGNGIPYLSTKESIGLGQEQQYTLILQTLQQLKDVYGDSVDKILQGNTGNIIYLKSTDDSMLETLEKMSGTRHEAYTDSKTVTKDVRSLINGVDGKISHTTAMKEIPTISTKDMLLIPPANAMVFGKGHPIWARNEMAMPMSYELHGNQLKDPEQEYVLETVPTTSNTDEFDVIANKPNFMSMVDKRVEQAKLAKEIRERYKEIHNLTDDGMSRIQPEVLAQELMQGINDQLLENRGGQAASVEEQEYAHDNNDDFESESMSGDVESAESVHQKPLAFGERAERVSEVNNEVLHYQQQSEKQVLAFQRKIHAGGQISKYDLRNNGNKANRGFDPHISETYREIGRQLEGNEVPSGLLLGEGGILHVTDEGELYLVTHSGREIPMILSSRAEMKAAQKAADDESNLNIRRTPELNTDDESKMMASALYEVSEEFYKLLVDLSSWDILANGRFDIQMAQAYRRHENMEDYA